MCHTTIELALEEEGNYEPVHSDKTIEVTVGEYHHYRYDDSKRHFKQQMHVPEQHEYQLQVHILQMYDLTLGNLVLTFSSYFERFRY